MPNVTSPTGGAVGAGDSRDRFRVNGRKPEEDDDWAVAHAGGQGSRLMVIFEICIVKVSHLLLQFPDFKRSKVLIPPGTVVTVAWYSIPKDRGRRLAVSAIGENNLTRDATINATTPIKNIESVLNLRTSLVAGWWLKVFRTLWGEHCDIVL